MSFNSDVGGANATSYISIAEADEYMASRLYTDSWDAANNITKEKALQQATTELERFDWKGEPINPDVQRLRFPRSGLYDLDGSAIDEDIIPTFLIYATAELALSQTESNRYAENEATGLSKVVAGETSVSWDRHWQNTRNPITVNQMINPWLLTSASGNYTLLLRA